VTVVEKATVSTDLLHKWRMGAMVTVGTADEHGAKTNQGGVTHGGHSIVVTIGCGACLAMERGKAFVLAVGAWRALSIRAYSDLCLFAAIRSSPVMLALSTSWLFTSLATSLLTFLFGIKDPLLHCSANVNKCCKQQM
jgi:hypothetical protein